MKEALQGHYRDGVEALQGVDGQHCKVEGLTDTMSRKVRATINCNLKVACATHSHTRTTVAAVAGAHWLVNYLHLHLHLHSR